jgi:hypothetical protein
MPLSRIQKTFIRLAAHQQSYWSTLGRRKTKRHHPAKYVTWEPTQISVEVINAVTGEKTTAKAYEESVAKLKKWLKLRNLKAELVDVVIKKGSTWSKLTPEEFVNYPIILKIGTYKTPYLVKSMHDLETHKGKTTVSFWLETTNNVDYLQVICEKKDLLEKGKKKKGSK